MKILSLRSSDFVKILSHAQATSSIGPRRFAPRNDVRGFVPGNDAGDFDTRNGIEGNLD